MNEDSHQLILKYKRRKNTSLCCLIVAILFYVLAIVFFILSRKFDVDLGANRVVFRSVEFVTFAVCAGIAVILTITCIILFLSSFFKLEILKQKQ